MPLKKRRFNTHPLHDSLRNRRNRTAASAQHLATILIVMMLTHVMLLTRRVHLYKARLRAIEMRARVHHLSIPQFVHLLVARRVKLGRLRAQRGTRCGGVYRDVLLSIATVLACHAVVDGLRQRRVAVWRCWRCFVLLQSVAGCTDVVVVAILTCRLRCGGEEIAVTVVGRLVAGRHALLWRWKAILTVD